MINSNNGPGKYLPVQKTFAYEVEKRKGGLNVTTIKSGF